MAWPIVNYNGTDYYRGEGFTLVPVDPTTGVVIIMLKEDGGVATGLAAIAEGPAGPHSEIDETIGLTMLEWDDPTPDSDTWTELQPANGANPQIVRLNSVRHKPQPGEDGASVLNPASFGTPAAKHMLVVKTDLSGFEFQAQKVGDRYFPVEINASGTGDADKTLAIIHIPAQPGDCRVSLEGQTVITGSDVKVDFVARLTGETSGNVVAQCTGIAATERLTFAGVKPPVSGVDTFDRIPANTAVDIYVRVEQQSGAGTYTTSVDTTWCSARVHPIP